MSLLLGALLFAAAAVPGPGAAAPAAASAPAASLRPPIVQRRIRFGARRRREMAAYSARHYGRRTYRLRHPHVIVEHYTANTSLAATIDTFASDAPDPELHERPGTCAHFVIDSDGTIYQLVPLRWRCRHTVGLNWTAIGIEHVGTSDAAVMDNPRVLRASLRLTRWLRCRDAIRVRDVIGHSESLASPYHHERVARLRAQTHADMTHASMQRYRAKLAKLGCT
jgi:N-acetylmuramoyl-L-alanine amidase